MNTKTAVTRKKKQSLSLDNPLRLLHTIFNKQVVIMLAGIAVIVTIAVVGRDPFVVFFANTAAELTETFESIPAEKTSEPSLKAVIAKLKAEGITVSAEQLSWRPLEEGEFKYRWQEGLQQRTWFVYLDHTEKWVVNEL